MYSIQSVKDKDIPTIQQLADACWYDTYHNILSPDQLEWMFDWMYSRHSLEEQLHTKGHRFFILLDDQQPVGFFSLEKKDETCIIIQKLYLMPTHQGKGLGKHMLEAAESEARNWLDQIRSLELHVNRQNKAVEFYKRMGFFVAEEGDFPIGKGYYMRDYVMRRLLV